MRVITVFPAVTAALLTSCAHAPMQPAPAAAEPAYDLLLRNGTIYDGAGKPPVPGDIAVAGSRMKVRLADRSDGPAGHC
jgi:N-acyl-D-amino-acid deacylase